MKETGERKMSKTLMDATGLHRTVIRLSHEIGEKNKGYQDIVLVGAEKNGEIVAKRIQSYIRDSEGFDLPVGMLASDAKKGLGFSVDKKTVVLCSDVLHTGRSAVKCVDALFDLGNPKKIQLLVLVDRGGRELPVRADFVGKNAPTSKDEYIEVCFEELGSPDCFSITRRQK